MPALGLASHGSSRALLPAGECVWVFLGGRRSREGGCPALCNENWEPEKTGAFLALEGRKEAGTRKGVMVLIFFGVGGRTEGL